MQENIKLSGFPQAFLNQISEMENRIAKLNDKLSKLEEKIEGQNSPESPCKILRFPLPDKSGFRQPPGSFAHLYALPGNQLPPEIPDFRPFLQRDGLILLGWNKTSTEIGERFTAYWVTSSGLPRYFASKPFPQDKFIFAKPHHKSYAAEDGIEFYGQPPPVYIIHVAPELLKSNPQHDELRFAHIKILKDMGSNVDFNYRYLLTAEKKNRSSLTGRENPPCLLKLA